MSNSEVHAEVLEFDVEKTGGTHREMLMVPVEKESQQVNQDAHSGQWADPRVSFQSLLQFLDLSIWHKRSVYLKAALICGLGWELQTDDENKEPDTAHKQIMKLLENPNSHPYETFTEINFRAMIDYQATGNLFIEAPRNLKGLTAEMWHTRVKTMRRDSSLKKGYWQIFKGRQQQFRAWGQPPNGQNEILHHYAYDPQSAHYGIPEWYPALAEMLMDRSIVEYSINLFENQLMAKFMIVVEGGKLSTAGRESLKNYLSKNFHGVKNAGRTIVIDSDDPGVKIRIEKLEVSFGDKESFKSGLRTTSRDNIIAAHGIPPRLLSIVTSGQLGAGGENEGQLKTFKETVIDPEQSRYENFLNNTVIASFGDHKWRLKFKEFNPTNFESLAKALTGLVSADIIDTNEAREDLGKKPREDDEVGRLTSQIISLRKSLEATEG